jgi:hypothetical protein
MGRIVMVVLAAGLAALAAASLAEAQGRPAPSPEQMQQQIDAMGPAMAKMTENMYAGMLRALSKPESAEQLATFMKNYRDALVAKGFTKEEAMQIVKAAGMPVMPSK